LLVNGDENRREAQKHLEKVRVFLKENPQNTSLQEQAAQWEMLFHGEEYIAKGVRDHALFAMDQ
jgi:hypothetical protein